MASSSIGYYEPVHEDDGTAALSQEGQAPDVLIVRRLANGIVERSRPIYPYPILARYSEPAIRNRRQASCLSIRRNNESSASTQATASSRLLNTEY
jgi:hypothetical protein